MTQTAQFLPITTTSATIVAAQAKAWQNATFVALSYTHEGETMAQSASIRLDHLLVKEADAIGKIYKRSPPRQIEYWAELGKAIEQSINPDDIIAIREGLSQVIVEPVQSAVVSSEDVFTQLANDRKQGTLSAKISTTAVNYQASQTNPGLLDQINNDGTITTGRFVNGHFEPAR